MTCIKYRGRLAAEPNRFLIKEQADRCLFLGPPAFLRMAKGMGYVPARFGPTVKNDDGSFLAFSYDVVDFPDYQLAGYVDPGLEPS